MTLYPKAAACGVPNQWFHHFFLEANSVHQRSSEFVRI